MLSKEDKSKLLKIARESLEAAVYGKKMPELDISEDSILNKKWGAFVTLNKNGELRGCIGYIKAYKPLAETVSQMAVSAGLKDSRFSPVTSDELSDIHIEISALSELEKVKNIEDIEVGKHGLYIKRGQSSGLLLPQVATEYGWTREEFLEHTCRKAWLPNGAWKDEKTEIYYYTAEIFGEDF